MSSGARFAVLCLVLASLVDQPATAQESLTYRPPSRDFTVNISGERIAYLRDGGCECQPASTVAVGPAPCNGATCSQSRTRSRQAVGAAIDGGALER